MILSTTGSNTQVASHAAASPRARTRSVRASTQPAGRFRTYLRVRSNRRRMVLSQATIFLPETKMDQSVP